MSFITLPFASIEVAISMLQAILLSYDMISAQVLAVSAFSFD